MSTSETFYQVERLYRGNSSDADFSWIPLDMPNTRLGEQEARERCAAMVPNEWHKAYRVVRITETRTVEYI